MIPMHDFTKKECIEALQSAANVYGRALTRKQYIEWQKENQDKPTAKQIAYAFGTFTEAKRQADLYPNKIKGKYFTDEEMIEALKVCSLDLGRKFSEVDYEKWRNKRKEYPSITAIRQRLGGNLNVVKEAIGLVSFPVGAVEKYEHDNWKSYIIDFIHHSLTWEKYEEWAKQNDAPSTSTLHVRVGGFRKALMSALPDYIEFLKEKESDS